MFRFPSVSECRTAIPAQSVDLFPSKCFNADLSPGNGEQLPVIFVKTRFDQNDVYTVGGANAGYAALYNANNDADDPGVLFPFSGDMDTWFKPRNDDTNIAATAGLAVYPVYPNFDPDGLNAEMNNQGPFLAFVSAQNINPENWPIDLPNVPTGSAIGIDTSFLRHDAVALMNLGLRKDAKIYTQLGSSARDYQRLINVGAVNPIFEFDTGRAKTTIQQLHSPLTLSNGYSRMTNPQDIQANEDPTQTMFGVSINGFLGPGFKKVTIGNTPLAVTLDPVLNTSLDDMIIDSQAGVGLLFFTAPDVNSGDEIGLTAANAADTLLHKLGFRLFDLFPAFNDEQTRITGDFSPYPFPLTTNAYIGGGETQALGLNTLNGLPMFDLSCAAGKALPLVTSAIIAATLEPTKLTEGTLLVRSDLASSCLSQYRGGAAGQNLHAFALVSRADGSGGFTYSDESSFAYTVLKKSTLTSVRTQINRMNLTPAKFKKK